MNVFSLLFITLLCVFTGYTFGEDTKDHQSTITEIAVKSWPEVLKLNARHFEPPRTVNYPLHPYGATDLVYANSALCVTRCRMIENIPLATYADSWKRTTFALQFAFGTFPVLPDHRQTKLSVPDKRLPLLDADYKQNNFVYHIEYCNPKIKDNSVLAIRVTVENTGSKASPATVWVKPDFYREGSPEEGTAFLTYHYQPFVYDIRRWFPSENLLAKDYLYRYGARIGSWTQNEFKCEWLNLVKFDRNERDQSLQNAGLGHVPVSLRLNQVDHVLKFSLTLDPGAKKSFEYKMLVDFENPHEAEHLNLSFDQLKDIAINDFLKVLPKDRMKLEFEQDHWTDIYESMHKGICQLLHRFPNRDYTVPSQGGSSSYHFTWVWESMFMMHAFLRTGCFDQVRDVLDYYFTLQNGSVPPEGRFQSLQGAIGTTGPKWINTTGSALILAADYYNYTQDKEFLNQHLSALLEAGDWILNEIRATRKLLPDGKRPAWYGIMPFGRGTDGSVGYDISHTDGYTWMGLKKLVGLLGLIHHPRYDEYKKELKEYQNCIQAALRTVTEPSGYIARQLTTGDRDEIIYKGFDNTIGIYQMAYNGVLDPYDPAFQKYMNYFETNRVREFFFGDMGKGIMYIGSGELGAQYIYLRTRQWKKAFSVMQTNILYGMTADTLITQERFSMTNPDFTPWQPNGSGNGRMLDMMLNAFCFEGMDDSQELTLLGGMPFEWLQHNPATLTNLRLFGGTTLQMTTRPQEGNQVELTVTFQGNTLPKAIVFPDTFSIEKTTRELKKIEGGIRFPLEKSDANTVLHFIITQAK